MSLYKKILWLFIGVAILPHLIFAALAREQTLELADRAAEAELLSAVAAAGDLLEQEAAVAEATLRGLARSVPSDPVPELLQGVLAAEAGPQPGGFHYLALRRGEEVLAEAGQPDLSTACVDDRRSQSVRSTVEVGESGVTLIGAYRPGGGAGFRPHRLWVYDASGALVLATTCEDGPAPTVANVELDSGRPIILSPEQGDQPRMALARVGMRGWTVAVEGRDVLSGPVEGFFRVYWLFVVSLAASTLLAFSVFLRSMTSSLNDLTRAVERVAGGDLSPWVPTPRDDEIGRLTRAFHEMTQRLRDMVTQVERSSRLAVLGKLSAYLAHEIRNPLSAVKMNLQRLERWYRAGDLPERSGGAIDISLKEVDRLSSAVSNILQLSPSREKPKELVALHDLLTEVGELLAADFRRHQVELLWELDAESDRVVAEPGQLKGVFINIMLNALDAQPDGGELRIRTALRAGGEGSPGPHVEVRFTDRGPGVSAEIAPRIFEPFFTTRSTGSGVGLAVASQTVRDHGGEIHLVTTGEGGSGGDFAVTLPLAPLARPVGQVPSRPRVASWLEPLDDDPMSPIRTPDEGADGPE